MTAPRFDDRRTGPLAALRSRWWLAVALVLIGGLIGGWVAHAKSAQYTAESRLVIGSNDLAAYQVAGFAQASEQLASNYARYVDNSSIVSMRLQADLKSSIDRLVSVSASPIPDSDVVSVEVVATSKPAAISGAQSVADTLVDLTKPINSDDSASLLKSFASISAKVQSQSSTVDRLTKDYKSAENPSPALTSQLDSARTQLSSLKLQASAAGNLYTSSITNTTTTSQLIIISHAAVVSNNSKQTLQIYVSAGAIAGLLLALLVAVLLAALRDPRPPPRSPSDTGGTEPIVQHESAP